MLMWRRLQIALWVTLCLFKDGGAHLLRTSASSSTTSDETTVVGHDEDRTGTRRLKKNIDEQEDTVEEDPPFNGPPPAKVAPAEVSGDRRTVDNLLTNFQMAKARLLESIEATYGGAKYFETLFLDHEPAMEMPNGADKCTVGRNAFLHGSDTSAKAWARTVRKMKINLLEYLISGNVQDFVWATAGNDAAAGHGNFFDEQYTIVLQDVARDLFHSVGLDLVARPFGMGGATSAPEIAGCAREIFGADVDMITWDFAMTDGRWYWRMEFFSHRVMMLKNHPTMLVLNSGNEQVRRDIVDHLTEQGMAALRQDGKYTIEHLLQFPDCKGKSKEEIALLPERLQYMRCGYAIENGLGCGEHKFTKNGTCDERPHQTNWHKGWKWHAYHGNLYALFLMELMEDALHELKGEGEDYGEIYHTLQDEEAEEFRQFEAEAELMYDIQWSIDDATALQFYRDPVYCHTANVPAQTRYLGYVLNKERYDDWFSYSKGMTVKNMRLKAKPEIRLGYVPIPRDEKDPNCTATLSIDSKEFFYATQRYDGYQKIIVPNDAEVAAYDWHRSSGIIAACAAACSFECAGSPMLSPDHIHVGKAEMKVNGEPVNSVVKFDNCFLLKREDGTLHWPSNVEGRYEIEVQVLAKNKEFRFSSFIVW
mmetsp:Transcript_5568/g.10830  ORF Transcript_5568/g.10830 Transcript_5568/m.10830 type:complete len:649 (-) Transcript_5568:118-2064(-)